MLRSKQREAIELPGWSSAIEGSAVDTKLFPLLRFACFGGHSGLHTDQSKGKVGLKRDLQLTHCRVVHPKALSGTVLAAAWL